MFPAHNPHSRRRHWRQKETEKYWVKCVLQREHRTFKFPFPGTRISLHISFTSACNIRFLAYINQKLRKRSNKGEAGRRSYQIRMWVWQPLPGRGKYSPEDREWGYYHAWKVWWAKKVYEENFVLRQIYRNSSTFWVLLAMDSTETRHLFGRRKIT